MIEFYPQIKSMHVMSVLASGLLFLLRGAALLAGQRWPSALVVRALSWSIDTVLLTAALMLFTMLPREMFGNGWLATKFVLLLVYIALGTVALKRGRNRRARAIAYVAALATFAFMVGVARAHHPLGPLSALFA